MNFLSTANFYLLTALLQSFSSVKNEPQHIHRSVRQGNSEQKIVVITASYNNAAMLDIPNIDRMRTCDWNLKSIFEQHYSNFEVRYRDDVSDDGTDFFVKEFIRLNGLDSKIKFTRNEKKLGALRNQYEEIMNCDDNDIIVIVDGDDGLVDPEVFKYLNQVYSDPNVWLTYGQFRHLSNNQIGFCQPMPNDVIINNSFRKHRDIPSHLRTCRAWLFKKIKKEDLMMDGEFLKMTGDMATWIPMIEMASRGHFKFIDKALYQYNDLNPISDHHKDVGLQKGIDNYIRSLPPYKPL